MDNSCTNTELAPIDLAGMTFNVNKYTYTDGHVSIWLTGPRGAKYFLRGFLGEDNGVRQVISWNSGAPLRKRGNEIRVVQLGDVIEVTPPRLVRGLA